MVANNEIVSLCEKHILDNVYNEIKAQYILKMKLKKARRIYLFRRFIDNYIISTNKKFRPCYSIDGFTYLFIVHPYKDKIIYL